VISSYEVLAIAAVVYCVGVIVGVYIAKKEMT
jgi:uncharacterized protein YneF (UPF0154 family)